MEYQQSDMTKLVGCDLTVKAGADGEHTFVSFKSYFVMAGHPSQI